MNIPEDQVQTEAEINAVKNAKFMSEQQKQQRIQVLRSSRLTGTDTSIKTVLSLTNTMIGSAVIIYPVLFLKDGIIGSSLIMLAVGCIQFLTCRLLVIHNRTDQPSFNQSILRIGGVRVSALNSLVNMLLLFFVCIAYYLLIATNFFQISSAIAHQSPQLIPTVPSLPSLSSLSCLSSSLQTIKFNVYSIQWACLICSILCLFTLFKTDIQPILKLIKYSIYCVMVYFIFILVCVVKVAIDGTIDFKDMRLFDSDFSSVAGAFALSFLIHPTASPILKKSINLKNNQRDLMFGYIMTAGVYFYVGFVGGLTCSPKALDIQANPSKYSTIFDCFNDRNTTQDLVFFIIGKVVQCGIFFQNFSVLPILFFLTRKQFLSLVNKPEKQRIFFIFFTLLFLVSATLVGVLEINVSLILSFDGAVVGFFMGYGIPIYIHLRCLFHKYTATENESRKKLVSGTTQQSLMSNSEYDEETEKQLLKCNEHKPRNKAKTLVFYGFILIVGAALGVFKISSFFG